MQDIASLRHWGRRVCYLLQTALALVITLIDVCWSHDINNRHQLNSTRWTWSRLPSTCLLKKQIISHLLHSQSKQAAEAGGQLQLHQLVHFPSSAKKSFRIPSRIFADQFHNFGLFIFRQFKSFSNTHSLAWIPWIVNLVGCVRLAHVLPHVWRTRQLGCNREGVHYRLRAPLGDSLGCWIIQFVDNGSSKESHRICRIRRPRGLATRCFHSFRSKVVLPHSNSCACQSTQTWGTWTSARLTPNSKVSVRFRTISNSSILIPEGTRCFRLLNLSWRLVGFRFFSPWTIHAPFNGPGCVLTNRLFAPTFVAVDSLIDQLSPLHKTHRTLACWWCWNARRRTARIALSSNWGRRLQVTRCLRWLISSTGDCSLLILAERARATQKTETFVVRKMSKGTWIISCWLCAAVGHAPSKQRSFWACRASTVFPEVIETLSQGTGSWGRGTALWKCIFTIVGIITKTHDSL